MNTISNFEQALAEPEPAPTPEPEPVYKWQGCAYYCGDKGIGRIAQLFYGGWHASCHIKNENKEHFFLIEADARAWVEAQFETKPCHTKNCLPF